MASAAPLRRFLRTPKGQLLVVLALFVALAAPAEGPGRVARGLAAAVIAAGALDALALRWRRGRWELPSGALLTGAIVAMVLSPHEPWPVAAATAALAIASKHAFRTRAGNVFNPAALALVAGFHLFGSAQSWWGALPGVAPVAPVALLLAGAFVADRVDRVPLVLAFLGAYFLLFTAAAFAGDPEAVSEVFRAPDLEAALFFAFFILTDPPTAPVGYPDQAACGVLVALAAFLVFEWLGAAHYLLAGVLVGNAWEAWRRARGRAGGPARGIWALP